MINETDLDKFDIITEINPYNHLKVNFYTKIKISKQELTYYYYPTWSIDEVIGKTGVALIKGMSQIEEINSIRLDFNMLTITLDNQAMTEDVPSRVESLLRACFQCDPYDVKVGVKFGEIIIPRDTKKFEFTPNLNFLV